MSWLYKVTKHYNYAVIFENREEALKATGWGFFSIGGLPTHYFAHTIHAKLDIMRSKLKTKLDCVGQKDTILCIAKEEYSDKIELWHCLINQKIGWLAIPTNHVLEEVK
jgi:hypothetical protein